MGNGWFYRSETGNRRGFVLMEFIKNDAPTDKEFMKRLHQLMQEHVYSSRAATKEFATHGSERCKKLLENWPKGQRRKPVSDFWKRGI